MFCVLIVHVYFYLCALYLYLCHLVGEDGVAVRRQGIGHHLLLLLLLLFPSELFHFSSLVFLSVPLSIQISLDCSIHFNRPRLIDPSMLTGSVITFHSQPISISLSLSLSFLSKSKPGRIRALLQQKLGQSSNKVLTFFSVSKSHINDQYMDS